MKNKFSPQQLTYIQEQTNYFPIRAYAEAYGLEEKGLNTAVDTGQIICTQGLPGGKILVEIPDFKQYLDNMKEGGVINQSKTKRAIELSEKRNNGSKNKSA